MHTMFTKAKIKWNRLTRGMTLTELLVASILVGIVMLGVASFSIALKHIQGGTSRSALLAMRTHAAMAKITKDAYATVGDATNPGIKERAMGQDRSICFRKDTNDPSSYTDDTWSCYYRRRLGSSNNLWRCTEPTPPAKVPPANLLECNNGGTSDLLLNLNNNDYFTIVTDTDDRLEYIEFTFTAIIDRSAAVHPVDNPLYTLVTRVSPPGHSR